MNDVAQVLMTALEMERLGREYYLKAADKVNDTVIESVLISLADDEKAHESVLSRYYEALEDSKGWPEINANLHIPADAEKRLCDIIEQTAGAIGPDDTFLSVYETARDLEQKSIEFYRSEADKSSDKKAIELYKFLLNVEDIHIKMLDLLLKSTREIVENTG